MRIYYYIYLKILEVQKVANFGWARFQKLNVGIKRFFLIQTLVHQFITPSQQNLKKRSFQTKLEDMVAKRYYFKLLQRASTFSQGLFCTTGRKESILLFWPLFGLLVITLVLIKKIQKTNKNIQKTHTNLKNKTTQCFF